MNLKIIRRGGNEFSKGIIKENPVLGLMLGLCSVLAVSTEVKNAVGMGAAMTFVLLGSNILVSLLRNSIPKKIRLPVFIVVIASFTTIVDLVMNAYFPAIHKNLGIFIPLIVVNCIIIARAEAFASKNPVGIAIVDAFGMGLGYTLAMFILAAIREIFGNGTFWGIKFFEGFNPVLIMILPAGAFITIGLMMAVLRVIKK
ncbi:MAG: electron transport complex subunit E [Elusimicrobia bacterium]|nr:electron transport complex subunit E [Elusimicrobiota bacterium]